MKILVEAKPIFEVDGNVTQFKVTDIKVDCNDSEVAAYNRLIVNRLPFVKAVNDAIDYNADGAKITRGNVGGLAK